MEAKPLIRGKFDIHSGRSFTSSGRFHPQSQSNKSSFSKESLIFTAAFLPAQSHTQSPKHRRSPSSDVGLSLVRSRRFPLRCLPTRPSHCILSPPLPRSLKIAFSSASFLIFLHPIPPRLNITCHSSVRHAFLYLALSPRVVIFLFSFLVDLDFDSQFFSFGSGYLPNAFARYRPSLYRIREPSTERLFVCSCAIFFWLHESRWSYCRFYFSVSVLLPCPSPSLDISADLENSYRFQSIRPVIIRRILSLALPFIFRYSLPTVPVSLPFFCHRLPSISA